MLHFLLSCAAPPCPPSGRIPNTSSLGLAEAGVELGPKGQVKVDDFCRTSVPSIFAVGDVIDRIQLTPGAGWGAGARGGEGIRVA